VKGLSFCPEMGVKVRFTQARARLDQAFELAQAMGYL